MLLGSLSEKLPFELDNVSMDVIPITISYHSSWSEISSTNFGVEAVWPDKTRQNVYKSCPKMVSLEKWIILTPLQKLPKNGENWGKLIVAKGFKKLPKVQNITQSGHTDVEWLLYSERKYSAWMLQVAWPVLTNKSALFHSTIPKHSTLYFLPMKSTPD